MNTGNRIIILLFLPMIIFLWLIGWNLEHFTTKRKTAVVHSELYSQNCLILISPIEEQNIEMCTRQRGFTEEAHAIMKSSASENFPTSLRGTYDNCSEMIPETS